MASELELGSVCNKWMDEKKEFSMKGCVCVGKGGQGLTIFLLKLATTTSIKSQFLVHYKEKLHAETSDVSYLFLSY